MAQETRYRVEILVLSHLEQNEVPLEQLELPDYSMAVDFLIPPVEADESEAAESPIAEDPVAGIADVIEPPEDPNRVIHIEEMSSIMQEAWRRLRLSG
ncbi:MAG: hypothetical protein MUP31_05175, partial [Xanthomonadales bacterium]|nr:hypothetical protein [Xanthomonadales bacterium]